MVITLFKNLIESYINNMSINDVIMFSKKENIRLNDNEYLNIYNYIKSNWYIIINDEEKVKEYLNNNFSSDKSEKIYQIFLKYKKRYSAYL